jgi:sigma-B regulation protein RsbU (phosphoserine phosphatase)
MYSTNQRPDLFTECWDQPAGRSGGDFVVSVTTATGVRIAIGDVAGHGDTIAPRAAVVRRLVERDLRDNVDEETFRRWNQIFGGVVPAGGFVCITYIEINPKNGQARIANAGNPSVLLRRDDGRIEYFPTTGMILGVVEDAEWKPPRFVSTSLEANDALVCFTDGLTERTGPGKEPFGLDRVVRAVTYGAATSALNSLRNWVDAFSAKEAEQDDLTVFCVKRATAGGPLGGRIGYG